MDPSLAVCFIHNHTRLTKLKDASLVREWPDLATEDLIQFVLHCPKCDVFYLQKSGYGRIVNHELQSATHPAVCTDHLEPLYMLVGPGKDGGLVWACPGDGCDHTEHFITEQERTVLAGRFTAAEHHRL